MNNDYKKFLVFRQSASRIFGLGPKSSFGCIPANKTSTHLHIRPGRFALQQGVQNRPHDGLLVWLISTNYIAGRAEAPEKLHIHSMSCRAGGQIRQVQTDRR